MSRVEMLREIHSGTPTYNYKVVFPELESMLDNFEKLYGIGEFNDKKAKKALKHMSFDMSKSTLVNKPKLPIKKVIYNEPATIIFWEDGSKTVAKCEKNEKFDKEKGFMVALLKKTFGNRDLHKALERYVWNEEYKEG